MSRTTWVREHGVVALSLPAGDERLVVIQVVETRRGRVRLRITAPDACGIAATDVGEGDAIGTRMDEAVAQAREAAQTRAARPAHTQINDEIPF